MLSEKGVVMATGTGGAMVTMTCVVMVNQQTLVSKTQ